MVLSLFHDNPTSESHYKIFEKERILDRLVQIADTAHHEGMEALGSKRDQLISLCTEKTIEGRAWTNGAASFSLAWRLRDHPEWPSTILSELDRIRREIRTAHGMRLRFLIFVGTGGPAEEAALYDAAGLLKRSPRCYILDSADPAKLKCILDDMIRRSGLRLADALRSTLVVGFGRGASPDSTLFQLEKLAALWARNRVRATANFRYFAPIGSAVDRFGVNQGYQRIPLRPDELNSFGGSGPLSRSSLYPLGLAKLDLERWTEAANLSNTQIQAAWRLAAFLNAQADAGRTKLTLVLPKPWSGVGAWTKLSLDEGLAASLPPTIRVILENKIKLANYRSPKDHDQDRSFLALKVRGFSKEVPDKAAMLRRAGYPLATLTFAKAASLSSYMQFVHFMVFGLSYLRRAKQSRSTCSDSYDSFAASILREASKTGGVEKSSLWRTLVNSTRRIRHRGCISLYNDWCDLPGAADQLDAPTLYATMLKRVLAQKEIDYAELVFFGDTRYCPQGRSVLKALQRAAERLFRSRLKLSVHVGEGTSLSKANPRRCLSTLILSEKSEKVPGVSEASQYHLAQFVAANQLLAEQGGHVVAVMIKDLQELTIGSLEDFFRQAAASLRTIKV